MRFQTRLLLTYSLLVLLLDVFLGIGFVLYTSNLFEANARSGAQFVADKILDQFESQFRSMDFLETNLVSDGNFKSSLDFLGTADRSNPANRSDVNDAVRIVRSALYNYAAIKNFYAVNVFNNRGDFFSSNFLDHVNVVGVPSTLARLTWAPQAVELYGKPLLVGPYPDPWSPSPRRVFSLARYMPGSKGDLGYIEVQNDAAALDRLFSVPDPRFTRVAAWTDQGQVFYQKPALTDREAGAYRKAASLPENPSTAFPWNPATGRDELILSRHSDDTGLTLVLALDRAVLVQPLLVTASLTLWTGLAILAFSVLYNWWSSRQLTQPLRLIQKRMEGTELQNLPHSQPLDHPNDEITALNDAFQRLKERLDDAIQDEIQTRTLGVQTQLDSLQAQVNPHFLYNILTVLANKGLEAGDTEIGEICGGIADMLRYSTDTTSRTATLAEEVAHVQTYLSLMKKRFEDKLTFTIDVDPGLMGAALPKIVLQQVVENSVNHGFRTVPTKMDLQVRGWRDGDRWVLEFLDNGQGFDTRELDRQTHALAETARRLDAGEWAEGLSVGGLGLRNTYGRLHLFFGGRVGWTMENRAEGGARVTISAPLDPQAEAVSFRVLIAEDEPAAGRYLRALVERQPGFEVVAMAAHGGEALHLAGSTCPDLVLTDVRMPVLDGIGLLRALKETHPRVVTVIVSGYQEFEYARQALGLGVADYLLKPVDPGRLGRLLADLAQRLAEREAGDALGRIGALLAGQTAEGPPQRFLVSLVRHGGPLAHPTDPGPRSQSSPSAGWWTFPGRDTNEALWLADPELVGREDFETRVRSLATPSRYRTATVLFADRPVASGDLAETVRNLGPSLDRLLVPGKAKVRWGSVPEPAVETLDPVWTQQVRWALAEAAWHKLESLVRSLVSGWEREERPVRQTSPLVRQMLVVAQTDAVGEALRDWEFLWEDGLGKVDSYAEFADLAWTLFSGVSGLGAAPSGVDAPETHQRIRRFLQSHYSEPLSIPLVCDRFQVGQTTLSKLFRKYEGQTFHEYLTRLRLDAAERLLTESPQLPLKVVAATVGYQDPFHFSRAFKAAKGASPREGRGP